MGCKWEYLLGFFDCYFNVFFQFVDLLRIDNEQLRWCVKLRIRGQLCELTQSPEAVLCFRCVFAWKTLLESQDSTRLFAPRGFPTGGDVFAQSPPCLLRHSQACLQSPRGPLGRVSPRPRPSLECNAFWTHFWFRLVLARFHFISFHFNIW